MLEKVTVQNCHWPFKSAFEGNFSSHRSQANGSGSRGFSGKIQVSESGLVGSAHGKGSDRDDHGDTNIDMDPRSQAETEGFGDDFDSSYNMFDGQEGSINGLVGNRASYQDGASCAKENGSESHSVPSTGCVGEDSDVPVVCTPLAMIRLLDICEFQPSAATGMEEDISIWVKRRAKGFGKILGVSCDGFEDKILELLLEIEKKKTSVMSSSKKQSCSRVKGKRELRQLCSSVNYGQSRGKEVEGRRGNIFVDYAS